MQCPVWRNQPPRSFTSWNSLDRARRDPGRKFKPVVLGEIQAAGDSLQRGEQYSPSLRLGLNGWPHVAQGRLVGCPYRFARYLAFSTLLRQSGEQAMIDRP